jgi:hypothetical protein
MEIEVFVFFLYQLDKMLSHTDYLKSMKDSTPDGLTIEISWQKLESYLQDKENTSSHEVLQYLSNITVYGADGKEWEEKHRAFVGLNTRLLFLDTEGKSQIANSILDILEREWAITIEPINPPIQSWIEFLKVGRLHRAIISTRYGFRDISQLDPFDWNLLLKYPLISASISLECNGGFQVRMSNGSLTIYDDGIFTRTEYVAGLVERFLLNGGDKLELQSPC